MLRSTSISTLTASVSVAAIKGVTIWDLTSGIRVRPGFFAEANPSFARFVNDPRVMLVASQHTGRIQAWDVTTGQPVRTLSSRRDLQSLALSDDKRLCLAGYGDGTVRLLSSTDGTPASPPFDCPSAVRAATIDPTGRWMATVAQDGDVLLWDAQTAELLATLRPRDLEPTLSQRTPPEFVHPAHFLLGRQPLPAPRRRKGMSAASSWTRPPTGRSRSQTKLRFLPVHSSMARGA